MAPYNGQLYRARIVSFGGTQLKDINSLHEDLQVDVEFIDFGNRDTLRLKDIRDITKDLIDRLPPAFALKCCLDGIAPTAAHNEFMFELTESQSLIFKCKSKDEINNRYMVELFEPLHNNESFLGLYRYK